MPTPFLSSEEYDERAHQLYNEGQYDEALDVLREGLALYPNAVELHVGVGYARLAREEYAWARRSFEEALVLEPEHEDGLAGLGEVLLKLGQHEAALQCFRRVLELGYSDDIDLMLQIGRSLFREDSPRFALMAEAKEFFTVAVQEAPELADAVASLGYVHHRLGEEEAAVTALRRALQLDPDHSEARIYLANLLFDRGELEAAFYHLERTNPEDHWDELAIWRLIELRKSLYGVSDDDPEIARWEARLIELTSEVDDIDEMLAELEERAAEAPEPGRGQLELFGALLADLVDRQKEPATHRVVTHEGTEFQGTWEDIVRGMRDANSALAHRTLQEFMVTEARRGRAITGVEIPTSDAESFIRGSADAGLLRIVR